jgi:hypothetical protein
MHKSEDGRVHAVAQLACGTNAGCLQAHVWASGGQEAEG